MKNLISFFLILMGSTSFAGDINSGSFNPVTQKVELSVSYGGGCSEHTFTLELTTPCRESHPVQCELNLVHTTDTPDMCEMYITETLELDLPTEMLTDNYYEQAFITVLGQGDSEVSFQLPQ